MAFSISGSPGCCTPFHELRKPTRQALDQRRGPALNAPAAEDDPSGIATYSQAGANYGSGVLCAAFLTFPLLAAAQEICGRTALASGQGSHAS